MYNFVYLISGKLLTGYVSIASFLKQTSLTCWGKAVISKGTWHLFSRHSIVKLLLLLEYRVFARLWGYSSEQARGLFCPGAHILVQETRQRTQTALAASDTFELLILVSIL